MTVLGEKAFDCLVTTLLTGDEWRDRYESLCAKYSEKAVVRMFESLAARGYADYGASARTGWPTEKGNVEMGLPAVYGWPPGW